MGRSWLAHCSQSWGELGKERGRGCSSCKAICLLTLQSSSGTDRTKTPGTGNTPEPRPRNIFQASSPLPGQRKEDYQDALFLCRALSTTAILCFPARSALSFQFTWKATLLPSPSLLFWSGKEAEPTCSSSDSQPLDPPCTALRSQTGCLQQSAVGAGTGRCSSPFRK